MANLLEPNQVSVRDIPVWIHQSWNLLWRRPFLFFVSSIIYHFVALSTRTVGNFSLLLAILVCYITLLVLISFAESTDHCKKVQILPTYKMVQKVILCLLLLTVVYICIYVVSAIIYSMLPIDIPATGYSGKEVFDVVKWFWPGLFPFMILYMGIVVTSMWFLPPLLSLHELEISDARSLAKRAVQKNEWVIFVASYIPFLFIVALTLLTVASFVLSLVFVPLFAIYLYVSYRHVFLGKKENSPVLTKAKISILRENTVNQQTFSIAKVVPNKSMQPGKVAAERGVM